MKSFVLGVGLSGASALAAGLLGLLYAVLFIEAGPWNDLQRIAYGIVGAFFGGLAGALAYLGYGLFMFQGASRVMAVLWTVVIISGWIAWLLSLRGG